ncbi:MAG: 2OG-Fe(II) oxygenase family protein, partial [Pseudomonadota bacterium]
TLHERMVYPRVLCASDGIGRDPVQGESIDGGLPIDEEDPFIITEFPGLDAAMRAYQKELRRLALALLRAMAIALGLPRRHFDDGWTRSNSGLRSLHYLPLRAGDAISTDGFTGQCDDPKIRSQVAQHDGIGDLGAALRAYPHADRNSLLTLLCHDVVDGLQVLQRGATTEDDRWVDVPKVSANQVVVQVGQMTQRFSNDVYKATPHRVLKPKAPAPSRTTISMFFRPGLATSIEVPPSLRRPNDAGDIYDTVSVKEFLTLPRTDEEGNPVKLTSNILKDGRWVGARPGSVCVPNVA